MSTLPSLIDTEFKRLMSELAEVVLSSKDECECMFVPRLPSGEAPHPTKNVILSARRHAIVQAFCHIEPPGIAICHDGERFHYFSADAWTKPTETPFLPWSAPPYEKLAVVDQYGNVVLA